MTLAELKGKCVQYNEFDIAIVPDGCRALAPGEIIPKSALSAYKVKGVKPDYWSINGVPGSRQNADSVYLRIVEFQPINPS